MGTTTNQIENHIEHTREDLGANLQELENKVKSVTDWRRQFENNPMTMIGVAFGGGVLLGAMMNGAKRNRYTRRSSGPRAADRESNKTLQTWDNIKGALIGVAATRVKDFIGELVPDFHQHFDKAQSHRSTYASSDPNDIRERMSDPVGL
jgi:hypothetical protein